MIAPVWITATPPTPNGDLHVGHLAGPYVAADVARRFLRADGVRAVLTTGMDDYQSYVATRGLAEGRKADGVADEYGDRIAATWRAAGIEFDFIGRPRTDPGYIAGVQSVFGRLVEREAIVARATPLPYCARCDRWLYEAYVVGSCPHCGQSSNGNACEACGRPNDCGDLVAPRCVPCGDPAELRPCERLYFPLAPFASRLAAYWETTRMPPHLRALCARMLADGLPEIAVSHPSDWGVPVPVERFALHRVYVWFEMAAGYLAERDAVGEAVAPAHFFGFDNGYFHAVLFPAAYLASGEPIPLASAFVVNEFYRLDGQKFSTSRRHAVWADDALAEAGCDVVRYHVLRDRPTGRQTSFSRGDLGTTRAHLDELWNAWLDRLLAEAHARGGVVAAAPDGDAWQVLRTRLVRISEAFREAYSIGAFNPRHAVALLDETVRLAVDFHHEQEYHRDSPAGAAAYDSALVAQLAVASALAAWAAPVMPVGAARLSGALGLEPGRPVDATALQAPPPGPLPARPDRIFGSVG